MSEADRANNEKALTALLLMAFVLVAIALVREGVHFDNTADGERLFTIALFSGATLGFLSWTRLTGVTPQLSLAGPLRQLWLVTALAGLSTVTAASYVNRTFAAPTERARVAAVDSVREGRGTRWHVVVKAGDGGYERYSIDEETAARLKDAQTVRLRYARGALGFDYIAEFEPVRP